MLHPCLKSYIHLRLVRRKTKKDQIMFCIYGQDGKILKKGDKAKNDITLFLFINMTINVTERN